jgi:hypothetical protein
MKPQPEHSTPLYFEALWQLLRFEYCLWGQNFAKTYRRVRECPCGERAVPPDTIERICGAIDMVCVFYPKQVLCLQRSAATTCLLRRFGVPANLAIGTQTLPFRSHAWVEVDGRVANDKPYTADIYSVLDRW